VVKFIVASKCLRISFWHITASSQCRHTMAARFGSFLLHRCNVVATVNVMSRTVHALIGYLIIINYLWVIGHISLICCICFRKSMTRAAADFILESVMFLLATWLDLNVFILNVVIATTTSPVTSSAGAAYYRRTTLPHYVLPLTTTTTTTGWVSPWYLGLELWGH